MSLHAYIRRLISKAASSPISALYVTIPQVKYILAKRFTLVDSSKVPCLRALSGNDLLVGSFQRGCTPITQQETSPSYEAPWD